MGEGRAAVGEGGGREARRGGESWCQDREGKSGHGGGGGQEEEEEEFSWLD